MLEKQLYVCCAETKRSYVFIQFFVDTMSLMNDCLSVFPSIYPPDPTHTQNRPTIPPLKSKGNFESINLTVAYHYRAHVVAGTSKEIPLARITRVHLLLRNKIQWKEEEEG